MRLAALIALIGTLVAGVSVALGAAGPGTKPRASSLAQAAARTAEVRTQRYALELRIVQDGIPHFMDAQSEVAPGTISVHLQLGGVVTSDGTVILGSETAGLIDGPFLYERMPEGLSRGRIEWLRVRIASLSPSHPALRGMHGMTAMPLLHVLAETRAHPVTRNASIFRGTVAYDDPIVVAALGPLTAGLQFRDLRVRAWIGPGGLVRHVRITGRTANRKTTFFVDARLFAFGRPVHVSLPAEGTFMDQALQQLRD
jgi:hypothetical protein